MISDSVITILSSSNRSNLHAPESNSVLLDQEMLEVIVVEFVVVPEIGSPSLLLLLLSTLLLLQRLSTRSIHFQAACCESLGFIGLLPPPPLLDTMPVVAVVVDGDIDALAEVVAAADVAAVVSPMATYGLPEYPPVGLNTTAVAGS